MAETSTERPFVSGLLTHLARTRTGTRIAIVTERLWPLVLPLVIVASLFLSISWFGLFRIVPDWMRLAGLVLLALALVGSLWPLRLFRAPTPAEIDRRIERANRLEHAPVSTQTDRLAGGDDFAAALWQEHQKRMAGRLGRLSSDLPKTRVPERDPWGARAAAALLFVIAFAFSFGLYGGRPGDAFHAHSGAEALPARIDAWVTPPSYTGRAPVFLTADANRETQSFTVPQNSSIAVRVTGGTGAETLAFLDGEGVERDIAAEGAAGEAEGGEEVRPSTGSARRFAGLLEEDGTVSLRSGGGEIRAWAFSVTPDAPPTISFSEEPKRAVNGTLELAYQIEDDYGAASAEGLVELTDQDEDARPLYEAPELPLDLPRRDGTTTAETSHDLTEHPWAGAPVRLTLRATDDAGQSARSEDKTFLMPQRPFTNPLARALIEQRRLLALDANAKGRVLQLMDATTLWPEETFDNMSHYLGVVTAQTRLSMADSNDKLRDVVDYLWEVALRVEDGDLTAAEKRLRQAQEALRDAIENGASEEEIERLMAELRDAMREFLREFAERSAQNSDLAQQTPNDQQMMTQNDLERMMDQIEELAKSGARDQAEQLLSQLENMMNNLQAGRSQQQQNGGEQSEMRQQMDELGEIMRRQQEMMNETFRMDRQQRGQRGQQQQGQQGRQGQQGQRGEQGQGQQGEEGQQGQGMTPGEFAEAMRRLQEGQGQLQGDLEGLMEGLEGLGIQPGEGFGEAGDAMGEAEGALGEQEGERAVGEQGRALEALRRGAQDMMNQMQQAMQGERGGGEEGGRQQNADRDPLGRPRATDGPDFGDSVKVPDEIDIQRAREILDAIRRRLGDALSPELERDYLERLLEMR